MPTESRPLRSTSGEPSHMDARSYQIGAQSMTAPQAAAGLHLVATPIGNLGDITLRALETLAGADLVACEDTRITHRLMERFAIRTPLTPYHDHNAAHARPQILARIAAGGSVALVSDAGTPLISDPGYRLVRDAAAAGFAVTTLPGASSVLAALTLAALPTDRFLFEGFLPNRQQARRKRIADLKSIDATLVLFESGNRVAESLADLAHGLGAREAAIGRELTKLHEEVRRGTLADLARDAADRETRGEFVLVIGPPADAQAIASSDIDALLRDMLGRGSVKDAVAEAVVLTGRPRRDLYARALELTKEPHDPAAENPDA